MVAWMDGWIDRQKDGDIIEIYISKEIEMI
jgi:hypothetical protein